MSYEPEHEPLRTTEKVSNNSGESDVQLRSINVFSEDFDASTALTLGANAVAATFSSQRDRATFVSAEALNHIGLCVSVKDAPFRQLRAGRGRLCDTQTESITNVSSVNKKSVLNNARISRSDDKQAGYKEGMKVAARRRHSTRAENVLSSMMDDCVKMNGPLSLLAKAVALRLRVCVKLRERHRVRSHVQGRLVSFDKHMNMVLRDAREVFFDDKFRPRILPLTLLRGEHVVVVSIARPGGIWEGKRFDAR